MNCFKFLVLFLFITSTGLSQNKSLYVGTYTVNKESEGIYSYNFNSKTGELSNQKLVAKTVNPSFLTLSKNKKFLYAVNELGNNKGTLRAFKIQKNNILTSLNSISSNGDHPCHVQLNKNNSIIAVSNYSGGNVSLYTLKNGSINKTSEIIDHSVSNKKAHVHSARFYKKSLFVADLGKNFIAHYTLNTKNSYVLKDTILMKENAGPRHFDISKKGDFIYLINEFNSTISVLQNINNHYTIIQNISTLNDTYKGKNSCADIHLSKNQQFLYGSNRGENSIVVFKRNKKTGKLTKIQSVSVKGNWPRNFTLSPNGKFLLVANQFSNNISIFSIHKKTGRLSFKKSYEQAAPVCLVF